MITLTQSAELCEDQLVKGVAEEIVKECPMFRKLGFINVIGNSYAYVREDPNNMGSVGFHKPDDLLTESSAQFNKKHSYLYLLTGTVDVPNLIKKSRSDPMDQMVEQVKIKSKLMGHHFEEQIVYGNASTSDGFDGLHTWMAEEDTPASQRLTMATNATGAALTMKKLDEACDQAFKGGRPSFMLTTRKVIRNMAAYLRPVASYQSERDEYGDYFLVWQGIPIFWCDAMLDTELCDENGQFLAATGGATSSIFIVRVNEENGFIGLQNGGIEKQVWDKLENKDASRTRLTWYVGTALKSSLAVVRLCNITDATAAAA